MFITYSWDFCLQFMLLAQCWMEKHNWNPSFYIYFYTIFWWKNLNWLSYDQKPAFPVKNLLVFLLSWVCFFFNKNFWSICCYSRSFVCSIEVYIWETFLGALIRGEAKKNRIYILLSCYSIKIYLSWDKKVGEYKTHRIFEALT